MIMPLKEKRNRKKKEKLAIRQEKETGNKIIM